MDKGIFGFIFQHTKKQQVALVLITIASYPFYYYSLDLPKIIVNEAISGNYTEFPKTVLGYELAQINYLLVLCGTFLCLVLINGGFKYFLNVYRGVVGERMTRRLRYILINSVMRFPLLHFRNISEGEIVSMVTAETEPLGGFVGESISLPAFQGGMLVTALIFMFVQDLLLGLAAIAFYPLQAWLIPKLQRQVNLLAKEKVQHVRKLSERINEAVAGSAEIHAHDTSQYELADFSHRLGTIFDIRFEIYRKKFFIKFLNNFLAQITPFFFFSIGGYLVITGRLSIGALVAVLAAYKDLSPPWKELLDFYQRMEDAKIKYRLLIDRFEPPNMFPEDVMLPSLEGGKTLSGQIVASNLSLVDDGGNKSLENASFAFGIDEHVLITGSPEGPKSAVAKLIARQLAQTSGSLTIGGIEMMALPEYVTGRQLGYVDQDAYVRSGSIRDNLFYGLKHHPQDEVSQTEEAIHKRRESELSGNSPHDINADWLDLKILPDGNQHGLLQTAMQALRDAGLENDILAIGLRSSIDPEKHPELASSILQARVLIQERIKSKEFEKLVESWDRDSYNSNASVAENILFGTPVDNTFDIEALGKNEHVLAVLNKVGLYDVFVDMGQKVASLMVELFHDLPPHHEYFDRYSFISADDLPNFQVILNAFSSGGVSALSEEQRMQLLQLPFRLILAKHRLGLIGDEMEKRLLSARKAFAEDLPSEMLEKISFFDIDTYNPASSVLDNALFGKINTTLSNATIKIQQLVESAIDELDLKLYILEIGLDFEVGTSGRRLSVAQRQKLAIARNLIKNPRVMIVNEATRVLDSASQSSVFDAIKNAMESRGLVWVNGEEVDPAQFSRIFVAEAGKVKESPTKKRNQE